VLRIASSFMLPLAPGTTMTCADAVKKLLEGKKAWEVSSAGKPHWPGCNLHLH
jgi:hypothetical protein